MQFEYSYLEALAAVVREGTFEAAANSLHITQSAVSQRIKHLEEKTGSVLVVRGRPCMATEYGQHLCRHIEQVQLLEVDLRKNLVSIVDPSAGERAVIRIAVNSDSLATWFPEIIQRAGNVLRLHLDIIPDDQENTADRLRSGEALAAVTAEDKTLHGFRRVPLGSFEYLAVASPKFFEKHFSDGVTPESLTLATPLVFDRKDTLPQRWVLETIGEAVSLLGHGVPSFSGYLACCLNGAGWGMMPRGSVDQYLASGALVELMPGTKVSVPLNWQSSAQGSEVMKVLSSIVAEVARKYLTYTPSNPRV